MNEKLPLESDMEKMFETNIKKRHFKVASYDVEPTSIMLGSAIGKPDKKSFNDV